MTQQCQQCGYQDPAIGASSCPSCDTLYENVETFSQKMTRIREEHEAQMSEIHSLSREGRIEEALYAIDEMVHNHPNTGDLHG